MNPATVPTDLPEVGLATGDASLAWLLVALPALGALVLFLAGRRADRWGHWLGVGTVLASFLVGLGVFLDTVGLAPSSAPASCRSTTGSRSPGCNVDFGLRLDPLSLTFVLLITGVGVADPPVLGRLHEPRPGPAAVLRASSTCSSRPC